MASGPIQAQAGLSSPTSSFFESSRYTLGCGAGNRLEAPVSKRAYHTHASGLADARQDVWTTVETATLVTLELADIRLTRIRDTQALASRPQRSRPYVSTIMRCLLDSIFSEDRSRELFERPHQTDLLVPWEYLPFFIPTLLLFIYEIVLFVGVPLVLDFRKVRSREGEAQESYKLRS